MMLCRLTWPFSGTLGNEAARVQTRASRSGPVFTFAPLYLGTGVFGWILFLMILDWLNDQ
jgi:hypothetical protein